MGTINPATVSDGETIDASDLNNPINTIANEINGNLDADNITDGSITNAKLDTTTGELGGAWQDWTPTLSGITIGNGTVVAKYQQVGKTVRGYIEVTFGSTSSISNGSFTPPVTASSTYSNTLSPIGVCIFWDNTGSQYPGGLRLDTTTLMRPYIYNASATYASLAGLSATVPFTWAVNDIIGCSFEYQAA